MTTEVVIMNMSFQDYVAHYFEPGDFTIFLLIAFGLLVAIYAVFYTYSKGKYKNPQRAKEEFFFLSERFYESVSWLYIFIWTSLITQVHFLNSGINTVIIFCLCL